MKNYRTMGDDEESPSNDEQQEQQQSRLEAFALKRKATIGVCVYAAAIASTMMFAYSRHGSSSSSKTNDQSKVVDLHAVKTSMQSTDFTRLNQQVEAMLDQKQARKLVGGPAGAQAKADAAVAGISSSSSSSSLSSATGLKSSSSGAKLSSSSSASSSTTLSTPPQGTSAKHPKGWVDTQEAEETAVTEVVVEEPVEDTTPSLVGWDIPSEAELASATATSGKGGKGQSAPVKVSKEEETSMAALTSLIDIGLMEKGGKVTIKSASSPTKSPSSGIHKPTWKPSSKPAEHRELKSAAQKAAKEAAGTHYYEIKAKTTKAVPDNGLNSASATSDADVTETTEVVEVSLDTDFEKKEDKRESRKADKKAREEAEATGASVHTWNGETRRGLAGSPTKSPSSGLHKPTWRPSSKPAEHRMLSEKTASSVSQAAKNAIYGLSGPTKSPSTGLHKPTWKPTAGKPTGKPLENRRRLSNAHPGDLTTSTAGKGDFAEVGPSKSPSTGIHKPTWKPTQGKPSGKPVEPWKEGVESSHTEKKNSAHSDGEISKRFLKADVEMAGVPTKSPSSGIHKPTWRPSAKPAEHRTLATSTSKPAEHKGRTIKPNEHKDEVGVDVVSDIGAALPRRLSEKTASSVSQAAKNAIYGLSGPTKSPSTGLHKPTWKPTAGKPTGKPLENRRQLLGHHAARDAANDAKHGNDKLSKKESKKIIEKKADQLEDKKSQLKKAALSTNKDKISADRQLKSLKDKKEELKAFQAAQLADSEDVPSIYFESEVDPAYSFSSKFASSTTTNKSERDAKKADAKTKAKVAEVESVKASKGEVKQDVEKAAALQAIELKGEIKSLGLKTAAKEASKSSKSSKKAETVVFELNGFQGEQKKMAKWLAKAYEAISSSSTARSMLADKLHTPSSVGIEKETSVNPPSTATIIANSQAGQFLRSKNSEPTEVIVDESVGAPVLIDESVVMTASSSSSVTPVTTTAEVEEEEEVEMDAKTTKKLAILEKKLSKAEKKKDEEEVAKLEKKIAKLTPTTATTTTETMTSSAVDASTATTPTVEELLAKIDELEYDAKMDAFFSGEDKASTVKKSGGAGAAKTSTAAEVVTPVVVAAVEPVVEEVPVVLMSSAAPGAYMSGTIADVEGMDELLSEPLSPSEENPRPAGIKGVAKQVNHDGSGAGKRRLTSGLRGLKETDKKAEKKEMKKEEKKEEKKEAKKEEKSASVKQTKDAKKESKEDTKTASKKDSKKTASVDSEVVVLTKSQQAHAAKKASKAAAKDAAKSAAKSSSKTSSKISSKGSSTKEVLPEGVEEPKIGTTLLPPKIGTNKIKASNIILHQASTVKSSPKEKKSLFTVTTTDSDSPMTAKGSEKTSKKASDKASDKETKTSSKTSSKNKKEDKDSRQRVLKSSNSNTKTKSKSSSSSSKSSSSSSSKDKDSTDALLAEVQEAQAAALAASTHAEELAALLASKTSKTTKTSTDDIPSKNDDYIPTQPPAKDPWDETADGEDTLEELQAQLAKAEKKGDDSLVAKLEKKIAKAEALVSVATPTSYLEVLQAKLSAAQESGDADLVATIQSKIDKIAGTTSSSSSKEDKAVTEEEAVVVVEESEEVTKLLAEQALFVKLGDEKMAAKMDKKITKARAAAEKEAATASTATTSSSNAAVVKLEAEMATFVSLGDEKMAAKIQAKIDKLSSKESSSSSSSSNKDNDSAVMTSTSTTTIATTEEVEEKEEVKEDKTESKEEEKEESNTDSEASTQEGEEDVSVDAPVSVAEAVKQASGLELNSEFDAFFTSAFPFLDNTDADTSSSLTTSSSGEDVMTSSSSTTSTSTSSSSGAKKSGTTNNSNNNNSKTGGKTTTTNNSKTTSAKGNTNTKQASGGAAASSTTKGKPHGRHMI